MTLEEEAERATAMLAGKALEHVFRHRPGEILIQFSDGSRLFADIKGTSLELSITNEAATREFPLAE